MSDTQSREQEVSEYRDLPDYSTAVKMGGTAMDIIGRLLWVGVLIGGCAWTVQFHRSTLHCVRNERPATSRLGGRAFGNSSASLLLARAWDELCRPPRWR